ncbi:glycosyltransferase family 4 protein [Salinicola aestuarinus]|uniref:glycosyltransferase family 4 protein n=1 Tax=Salinicola aestuarinus TaxID=1949082 RepID=UPI000DA1FC3B|nr:glycosyltransferase family 4 protein [Salinicola aestuarinus]
MTRLKVISLVDDVSPGGVMQALQVLAHPSLSASIDSRVLQVDPDRQQAPVCDADIVITHFPPRWRALPFLASLKWRARGARLIHIEHSYTGSWECLKVSRPERFRLMLKLAYRLFDHVVAVSEGQAQWLRTVTGLPEADLSVVRPWSGVTGLDTLPLPHWQEQRPLVLGAYGRFAEQKAFDRLITHFRRLDPQRYRLRLGGSGPTEAALRALAAGACNIDFVGQVTDRAAFLGACDLIVVPSRWEAFGLVATEARQAGRPILVADVDGLPEQVGQAGRVVDFTADTELKAVLEALDGPTLQTLALAARQSTADLAERRLASWRELLRLA